MPERNSLVIKLSIARAEPHRGAIRPRWVTELRHGVLSAERRRT
jgi:hypothetical protein